MNIKLSKILDLPSDLLARSFYHAVTIQLLRMFLLTTCCLLSVASIKAETSDINEVYLQNRDELIQGYQSQGDPLSIAYSEWQAGATMPAKPGIHGNRFLMTYVNDIGHSDYVKYALTGVDMPIGSIVAKESFTMRGGSFKAGPMFFMEKVGIDKAPDADGWFYSRVKANGKPLKSSQKFCHSCHKAYAGQDFLGYPAPEVRFAVDTVVSAASPTKISTSPGSGDVDRGKAAAQVCLSCHQIGADAKNAIGPVLNDIVGRQAASYAGFNYSSSLQRAGDKGLVWDEETLFTWLADPSKFLRHYLNDDDASSQMAIQFADEQLRRDITKYLNNL